MDGTLYDHKKLQEIRGRLFTQDELARKLGRNVKTISRAETGKHASFRLLSEIMTACGRSIKEIILENEQAETASK